MIIGNKVDLEKDRKVSTQEGEILAKTYNVIFIETSTKNNINVDQAFVKMAKEIIEKLDIKPYKVAEENEVIKITKTVRNKSNCW